MLWREAARDYLDTHLLAQTVEHRPEARGLDLFTGYYSYMRLARLRCPLWTVCILSRMELIREFRSRVQIMGPPIYHYTRPTRIQHEPLIRGLASRWNPTPSTSSFITDTSISYGRGGMLFRRGCIPLLPRHKNTSNIYVRDSRRSLAKLSGITSQEMRIYYRVWIGEAPFPGIQVVRKEETDLEGKQVLIINDQPWQNTTRGVTKHDMVAYIERNETLGGYTFLFPKSWWREESWDSSRAYQIYRHLLSSFDLYSWAGFEYPKLRRITILI